MYSSNNGTSLPGTLKRSEGGASTGDSHVDMNYGHLGTTSQCYQNFGRDSYNGAGAQLRSSVHYSTNYVNAFWNGSQMVDGDGDGVNSIELGNSLDVTVHELTHAVTSSESNLTYSGSFEQNAVTLAWQAVGIPPPAVPATALTNGVAITGIAGASGSEKFYYLDVPAGRASSYVLSGGTGDADMYVKIGSQPTTSSYNCRPYLSGNNETCNIAAQTTNQRIYVMLRGYSSYSSTSLKGTY